MTLVKDLGVRPVGSSSSARFGLYECPICSTIITCNTSNVKSSKTGMCRACADKLAGEARRRKAEATLLHDFVKVHGEKYDYSAVVYKGTHTKIEIICKEHGVFTQTPKMHKTGQGCPACGVTACKTEHARIRNEAASRFAAECTDVHNGKYDYSLVAYYNSSTKVDIVCPIHGVFSQLPSNHKAGQGCHQCAVMENNIALRQAIDMASLYVILCKVFRCRIMEGRVYDV